MARFRRALPTGRHSLLQGASGRPLGAVRTDFTALTGELTSYGCRNKRPQTSWLKTPQVCCLKILSGRGPTGVSGPKARRRLGCAPFWGPQARICPFKHPEAPAFLAHARFSAGDVVSLRSLCLSCVSFSPAAVVAFRGSQDHSEPPGESRLLFLF